MEAYKVGVTFALNNLIGPELTKIAEQMAALNKAAEAFGATMRSVNIGMSASGGMSKSAVAMGESFKFAGAEIDGVRAKLARLNTEAARIPGAGGRSPRGPSGPKGDWLSDGIASYGPWGAAYAGYEALKGSMTMEDTIARAMIANNINVDKDYMDTEFARVMQSSIFRTSTGFGVSQYETQEAALDLMRGLAPMAVDQRVRLMPSLLQFAGAEVLGKHGTTMEEAVNAAIGLAHQLKDYTPEQIEPILGAFAKLSMASPASLTMLSRAGTYYLPLLTSGLGMDPTELLSIGAAGSQIGLNTKAGTWISAMFSQPFTSDLTGKRSSARREALEKLGLFKDGHVVTHDAFEFLDIMSQHAAAMSPEDRTRAYKAAFGEQGGRGAAIFDDPRMLQIIHGLADSLKGAKSPEELKQQYSNSPLVKAGQAQQQFNFALTKFGEVVLPVATMAMMGVVGAVMYFNEQWQKLKLTLGFLDFLHPGSSSASPPPPRQQSVIQIDHNTNLDGLTLARSVTKYQVDHLDHNSASPSFPDLRNTPMVLGGIGN